jgi:hypothetical protein
VTRLGEHVGAVQQRAEGLAQDVLGVVELFELGVLSRDKDAKPDHVGDFARLLAVSEDLQWLLRLHTKSSSPPSGDATSIVMYPGSSSPAVCSLVVAMSLLTSNVS